MVNIGNDWDNILEAEFEKPYYLQLREFLKDEYFSSKSPIYPDMHDLFNSFKYTSYSQVKVVILGQDPYHGADQAHGLCFSVKKGVVPPPSLMNIFKELRDELGIAIPSHGELTSWAKQGVLLLNTCLSVREGKPNSHKGNGWEIFTDNVIKHLNERQMPMVFLLWGANARAKSAFLDANKHLVLTCSHPSPLSAYNGFFGCGHFKKANEFLVSMGKEPIDWNIED